jgi:sugar O-acyltransferase (sialic acid O-acetyltransferase NeuD family)
MSVPLILVAASGLAREVLAALEDQSHYRVRGFVDDEPSLVGTNISGIPVLGSIEDITRFPDAALIVCAGRGQARLAIVERLIALGVREDRYATIIDPTVRVPRNCSIGAGSILLAHCVLTADVSVGRHVVVMPHATLTHDDRVHDFASLCAGVVLGGSVQVGRAAYLGMNASVREQLLVGADSILGMGAVLLEDLPTGQTWGGAPARPLKRVKTEAAA